MDSPIVHLMNAESCTMLDISLCSSIFVGRESKIPDLIDHDEMLTVAPVEHPIRLVKP